jgi:hypothetical protein
MSITVMMDAGLTGETLLPWCGNAWSWYFGKILSVA